jgi:hypothetical protein
MVDVSDNTTQTNQAPTGGDSGRFVGPLFGSALLLIAGVSATVFSGVPGEGLNVVGLLFGLILIGAGFGVFLSAISKRYAVSLPVGVLVSIGYLILIVCIAGLLIGIVYFLPSLLFPSPE